MSRRQALAILGGAGALVAEGALLTPVTSAGKPAVSGYAPDGTAGRTAAFPLQAVKLLDSPFRANQSRNTGYLLFVDPERMLRSFRINYGQPASAQPCGGWEAPNYETRGHTTGHLLSGLALTYANTGNEAARAKGRYLVSQLAGDDQALDVAVRLGDWVDWRTSRLSYARMQMVLGYEYGGLPEALANLYAITGTERYLAAARRFYEPEVFDPLAAGQDRLDGLQCNITTPKIIACLRMWEETGEQAYRDIAQNFWDIVTRHHTYVIGGSGNFEHWHAPDVIAGQLSNRTCEGCVSYNMLKLTRLLHFHQQDRTDLLDRYERTLFNLMLGTQDPASAHGSTATTPGCRRARSSSSR